MGEDHGNLIGGRWRSAGAGEGFVVATASGAELTRRLRAGARDLAEALGVLEETSHSWWGRSAGERVEVLDALELGAELGDCAAGVAARVGIGPEQALRLLEEDLVEVDSWEVSQVTAPGVALVRCAPTALLSGLVPLVKQSLERGWVVLLLADPSLPWLAESFARSWLRAGAPAGALALLHDDGATSARAALGSGRLSGVLMCDLEERLAEVEAAIAPRGEAGFGAGVVGGQAQTAFEGAPLRDATTVVTSGCDPEEEAAAVVEAAFGAALALGGEREGSIGRVVCHERLFSTFTASLLERFDVLEGSDGPLRLPLLQGLDRWVDVLSQAAVGEGATSLRGGASDSNTRGSRGKMYRSVFTNVEPNWRLARANRPAPALALLRASDDDRAHELALACDATHAPE